MPRTPSPSDVALRALREFGLAYPSAHTKSPWPGHLDLAVKDKTFAYLSVEGEPLSISCKLPQSSAMALLLPFAKPTGYGLGKSGWVSATFAADETPPLDVLKAWIDESYRAQAPKKLVASLGAPRVPPGREKSGAASSARAPAARKSSGLASSARTPAGRKKSGAASASAAKRAKPSKPSRRVS